MIPRQYDIGRPELAEEITNYGDNELSLAKFDELG
jgi:hypothetical protein